MTVHQLPLPDFHPDGRQLDCTQCGALVTTHGNTRDINPDSYRCLHCQLEPHAAPYDPRTATIPY